MFALLNMDGQDGQDKILFTGVPANRATLWTADWRTLQDCASLVYPVANQDHLYGRDGAVLPSAKQSALIPRRLAPCEAPPPAAEGQKIVVNR
jgi:hypothetical protein